MTTKQWVTPLVVGGCWGLVVDGRAGVGVWSRDRGASGRRGGLDAVAGGRGALWAVVGLAGLLGEFDPGSGRTLAACLRHASRAGSPGDRAVSGGRVSNAWVTYPRVRDNPSKGGLIPEGLRLGHPGGSKGPGEGSPGEGPASHQLVGGVTAHQGDDG